MTALLLITGFVFLFIAALYFWLNNNSPIQTRIPLFAMPLGIIALLLGLWELFA